MSGSGSIKVQLPSIRKRWRESPSGESWVLLKTKAGTFEDFRAALDESTEALEARYDGEAPIGGAWPTVAPSGFLVMLMTGEDVPEHFAEWAEGFADALETAGFRGTLAGATSTSPPHWVDIGGPCLSVYASHVIDLPARQADSENGNWHVPSAATERITSLAADWALVPGARRWLSQGIYSFEVSTDADIVGPLRSVALPATSTSVTAVDEERRHAVRARFGSGSTLGVYQVIDRNLDDLPFVEQVPMPHWRDQIERYRLLEVQPCWRTQADKLREHLVTMSEYTDLAVLRRAMPGGVIWQGLDKIYPLPGISGSDLQNRSHVLADRTPDAHGVQLLTSAHLDRANDLTDWKITDLGHDRHLVEAADLEPWYAQLVPAPEVLARARQDFGAMLLTTDDIKNNPPPWQIG